MVVTMPAQRRREPAAGGVLAGQRVAVVHEWLDQRAGSERVFERIASLLPEADLFALTHSPGCDLDVQGRSIATSYLDRSSLRDRRHLTLPLMPDAWRRLSRTRYDVVVSSTHAFGRYFGPARTALHLSYCHAPMRYIWNPELDDRGSSALRSTVMLARPVLRRLDRASVVWTDAIAVNSDEIAGRVLDFYGRRATVIHPPVEVEFFGAVVRRATSPYLLAVSRFVGYKRIDVAIEAAAIVGMPLVVAGSGPLEADLRRCAADRHPGMVRFEISPTDDRLRDLYAAAAALVYPALEDFGIVPVEAQAAGTPVVALGSGGTADTVIDGSTGVHVADQDPRSFARAIERLLAIGPSVDACRANAERFGGCEFDRRFSAWVAHEASGRGSPDAAW